MEQIKITIPMRLPGLNEYINECRKNRYAGANLKKQIENDCLIFIKNSLKERKLSKIGLAFTWYEKNKQRDKDNICFAKKFILDALQKSGSLQNDGWEQVKYFIDGFEVDKQNPRVEVLITEVD
jgi:Holliday junction resolvase RusA-like endonuclease